MFMRKNLVGKYGIRWYWEWICIDSCTCYSYSFPPQLLLLSSNRKHRANFLHFLIMLFSILLLNWSPCKFSFSHIFFITYLFVFLTECINHHYISYLSIGYCKMVMFKYNKLIVMLWVMNLIICVQEAGNGSLVSYIRDIFKRGDWQCIVGLPPFYLLVFISPPKCGVF